MRINIGIGFNSDFFEIKSVVHIDLETQKISKEKKKKKKAIAPKRDLPRLPPSDE